MLAAHVPVERIPRSPDDLVFLYTGGTTGLPKGVMWRHSDLFTVFSQGYQAIGEVLGTVKAVGEAAKRMREFGVAGPCVAAAPLMHGMAWFTSMGRLMTGSTVVSLTKRSFDAHELWDLVQRHRVMMVVIVGDAFARPMVRALEEAEAAGRPYDVSSLMVIVSGGVMWTAAYKQAFLDRGVPMLIDGLGSSEATGIGMKITPAGTDPTTAQFQLNPNTKVITEDGREVTAGSGEVGLLAVGEASGIPLGYYKDDAKTASTFRTIDGVRYSIPGDWAKVEADGSVTLLGRGSVCINTGGEKVFPEEVEEAIKLHPAVEDCTVVGVPDDAWGEIIVAVVSRSAGADADAGALIGAARARLAAFQGPQARRLRRPRGSQPGGQGRLPVGQGCRPSRRWAVGSLEDAAPSAPGETAVQLSRALRKTGPAARPAPPLGALRVTRAQVGACDLAVAIDRPFASTRGRSRAHWAPPRQFASHGSRTHTPALMPSRGRREP